MEYKAGIYNFSEVYYKLLKGKNGGKFFKEFGPLNLCETLYYMKRTLAVSLVGIPLFKESRYKYL